MNQKNIYSHLTTKDRFNLSFPAKFLLNKNKLIGNVLDYGCGLGKDVELLKLKEINIDGYDKYYFKKYPSKKYDTIICIYVLNVLFQEDQSDVLINISQLLKSNGKAYFIVRRDVKHEGFRIHKIHKKPTYQCNVILNYKSIFKNDSCEIYEYQHYNQIKHTESLTCPFCNPSSDLELIAESATSYAIMDKFPVSNGHALIIPKRHVSNYFDLSFKEQSAIIFLLNKAKQTISKIYKPDGINVGININKVAGQTVSHVHIHLIPRYEGDVYNPIGGVRNVVPLKGDYISNKNLWR